ncbi:MAG: anaerobic sulfite reductase subunit AsrA, partial [Oscillospiraceae bacterium]|nr:anaerobic sulfite reductase subunit AsrA [Oscillospiraceae bacterium]
MGYRLSPAGLDAVLKALSEEYRVYAPKRFLDGGAFSDTDCVRYGEIQSAKEIVFDEKSRFSFKELLTPISQTLFYFTEREMTEPEPPQKGALIFLRSCDLHAVRRLDRVYLRTGEPAYYYARLRERVKFVLMGCKECFDSCFCVDMGTNISADYDLSVEPSGEDYLLDCKFEDWDGLLSSQALEQLQVEPAHVSETRTRVTIPENLSAEVIKSSIWDEYDKRCINCGRCNFSCPTCTCYTMQDLFYSENESAGERRRVMASCMVDGFTDMAGGAAYRKSSGERMRFKVLHKVLDFKKRAGFQMC